MLAICARFRRYPCRRVSPQPVATGGSSGHRVRRPDAHRRLVSNALLLRCPRCRAPRHFVYLVRLRASPLVPPFPHLHLSITVFLPKHSDLEVLLSNESIATLASRRGHVLWLVLCMCHRLRYATFAGLGGADASDSGPGKPDVDSIDFWPVLSGSSSRAVPPRTEVVIGFNFTHSHPLQGALIVGTHKLIVNQQGYNSNDSLSWTPVDFPCSSVLGGTDCNPYCVFDVYDDPAERTDLSGNVTLLAGLLARYTALGKEPVNWHDRAGSKPGGRPPDDDYAETCALMTKEGGFWRPWRNSTTPPPPPPRPPGPGGDALPPPPGTRANLASAPTPNSPSAQPARRRVSCQATMPTGTLTPCVGRRSSPTQPSTVALSRTGAARSRRPWWRAERGRGARTLRWPPRPGA